MEVLILSKTHMGSSACVGGAILETGEFIRLMNGPKQYQPGNTDFEIGQVWDIEFKANADKAPHIEDVFISEKKFIKDIQDLSSFVENNFKVWIGGPEVLFDGNLKWTGNGSGYLNESAKMPANSVGFWKSDKDLNFLDEKYYIYKRNILFKRRMSYIGYNKAVSIIPTGTIIRVSLAKWWSPVDSDIEDRCYLQLSGWYS